MRFKVFMVLASLLMSGCSIKESAENAEREVARFHSRLNAGNYDAIWNAGDDRLRTSGSKADFSGFLATVHAKLGEVVETEQVGVNTQVSPMGTMVSVSNSTRFERGGAMESFTFSVSDNETRLVGYNINSRELIMNTAPIQVLEETVEPAEASADRAPD